MHAKVHLTPLPLDFRRKKVYNIEKKTVADMGAIYEFEKEKMIIGVIYRDPDVYIEAINILTETFGPIDMESERFSFSREFSTYYDSELGGEGDRVILSFERCVDASRQAEIKTFTNSVEARFTKDGGRLINLDPGFLNHGRLMLATTKETGFRIPLADGIYTELTLFWARGGWQRFPWTYRDYQSERVQKFLTEVRRKYLSQRKALKGKDGE